MAVGSAENMNTIVGRLDEEQPGLVGGLIDE
jgi:hypothetical protein